MPTSYQTPGVASGNTQPQQNRSDSSAGSHSPRPGSPVPSASPITGYAGRHSIDHGTFFGYGFPGTGWSVTGSYAHLGIVLGTSPQQVNSGLALRSFGDTEDDFDVSDTSQSTSQAQAKKNGGKSTETIVVASGLQANKNRTASITTTTTTSALTSTISDKSPRGDQVRSAGSSSRHKYWRGSEQEMVGEELVRLNVGGTCITTTKTTLLSKGENFFTPLLSGKIPTQRDETGAYFIDRSV